MLNSRSNLTLMSGTDSGRALLTYASIRVKILLESIKVFIIYMAYIIDTKLALHKLGISC